MRIATAIVDLSALPRWPGRVAASCQVARAVDPRFDLRRALGEALAPPEISTFWLTGGRLLLVRLLETDYTGAT